MAKLALLLVFISFSLLSFNAVTAVSRRPANIVGPTDDRGMIKSIGVNYLKLQPEEVTQLRNNVGHFHCPGNPDEELPEGSRLTETYLGAVTATGFLANASDVVVTAGHVFANLVGTQRPNLEKCYFQTQGDRPKRYFINVESIRHGMRWRDVKSNDDFAVVRLKEKVPGAQPLTVLSPPPELRTDMVLYPVTAMRPHGKEIHGDLPYEPLIQICKVRNSKPGTQHRPTTFYSDCDNESGGSGGPNLVRIGKQLVVTGIFYSAGPPALNGKPYSEAEVKFPDGTIGMSLAESVHIDSVFLRMIEEAVRASNSAASTGNRSVIGAPIRGSGAVRPSGAAVPVRQSGTVPPLPARPNSNSNFAN